MQTRQNFLSLFDEHELMTMR